MSQPWQWLLHQWREYERGPFVAAGIIVVVVTGALLAAFLGPS